MFVPHAVKPVSIYELTRLVTGIVLRWLSSITSSVRTAWSTCAIRKESVSGRWLEDHKPEIIVGVICVLLGASCHSHAGSEVEMTNLLLIGLAVALVAYLMLAKSWIPQPQKARKQEKAEIMRQLLALSDREQGIATTAPSVRSRTPATGQRTNREKTHQKSAGKVSQPMRSGKHASAGLE